MKIFTLFCLCIVCPISAVATELHISGRGGGGILQNLNERMADGVSSIAPAFNGSGAISLPQIWGAWDANACAGLDIALFPGTAFVGDLSLQLGVSRPFSFLTMSWDAALGGGPALTFAPTRDAGSWWLSTVLRLDLRCKTCPMGAGIYVRLQQIWMANVTDPWMLGIGISVQFDLYGRSTFKKQSVHTTQPVVTPTHLEDEDGDGVLTTVDRCPHSLLGAKVQENGCETVADGMPISTPIFVDGQAVLTPLGERECLRLSELLTVNTQLALVLQVSAATNVLAQAQFTALSQCLQKQGVPATRILPETRTHPTEAVTLSFRLLLQ